MQARDLPVAEPGITHVAMLPTVFSTLASSFGLRTRPGTTAAE
jgi:hypothetical protein